MIEKITSLQNPRIKNIVHLSKGRERKSQNLFVIEGYREISMAFASGFSINELYYSKEIGLTVEIDHLINKMPKEVKLVEISRSVFEKIAYRENSDGLLALATPRYTALAQLELPKTPLVLVLESVEKPGNLGAILRTADAANLDAVIVCDPQTDVYNPNVVRSSLGCIFTQQVVTCSTSEAIDFLRDKGIFSFAAALTAKGFYHDADFTKPTAIVMGTEADGLSETWLKGADASIKIPMSGKVDSLNVSTSAAILVFEARRQRNFS